MNRLRTQGELEAVHDARVGFVYNDFARSGSAEINVLHRADCRCLGKMDTKAYPKWFSVDEHAATVWLVANGGAEEHAWHRCRKCGGRS